MPELLTGKNSNYAQEQVLIEALLSKDVAVLSAVLRRVCAVFAWTVYLNER